MEAIAQILQQLTKESVRMPAGKISVSKVVTVNKAKHHFKTLAENVCSGYVIDDENREVVETLLLYFTNNQDFAKTTLIKNPSLKKGILLAGNIGTGKTLLMRILRECSAPEKRFGIKTCREIAMQFASDGIGVIKRFGSGAVRYENGQKKLIHMLFDDLGAEKSMNHYGNKINVMADIIQDRYEEFLKHGLLTHITTNQDLEEIETYYGNRVLSRMHELFNFISLGGSKDATDRRIISSKTN